jgi:hypothetical protein
MIISTLMTFAEQVTPAATQLKWLMCPSEQPQALHVSNAFTSLHA